MYQLTGYLLISSSSIAVTAIQQIKPSTTLWKAAIVSVCMSFSAFLVIAACALLSGYKLCKRIIWWCFISQAQAQDHPTSSQSLNIGTQNFLFSLLFWLLVLQWISVSNHSPFECDVNLGCVESPNNLLVSEKEKIVYA